MEGYQYVTSLDLKMELYTLRIFPTSKDITTIVTKFGKFKYNPLALGMCALGDIFQTKVDDHIVDIKGVKTCIDVMLVLRKESFFKHIEQLEKNFGRLRAANLKVNDPKCSFWLQESP